MTNFAAYYRFSRKALFALLLPSSVAWAVPAVQTPTGSVARGSPATSFTLSFSMTSIDIADYTAQKDPTAFAKNFIEIRLSCNNNARVAYQGETAGTVGTTTTTTSTGTGTTTTTPTLAGFQATPSSANTLVAVGSPITSYTFTGTFHVEAGSPAAECVLASTGILKPDPTDATRNSVQLDIYYRGTATAIQNLTAAHVFLYQAIGIANEAPAGLVAKSTYHGIALDYEAKTTINFIGKGGSAVTDTPAGVIGFLIPSDAAAFTIPGKIYKEKKEEETFGACDYIPGQDACITCQAPGTYLDLTAMESAAQVTGAGLIKSGSYTPGSTIAFNNLDPNKTYKAFMIYQPDDLLFSRCVEARPGVNYSLTELNQDDAKTSLKNPLCFIATAAYGTPFDKHIDILRAFRNQYLLTNPMGKAFVKFYYTNSPKYADMVAKSEKARFITRIALAPVVFIALLFTEHTTLLFANVLGLVLLGLWFARSRRHMVR